MAWFLPVGLLIMYFGTLSSSVAVRRQARDGSDTTPVNVPAGDPRQLAEQLHMKKDCLSYPPDTIFTPGDILLVSSYCCEDSCQRPLCSQRHDCGGQTSPVNRGEGPFLNTNVTILDPNDLSEAGANNGETVFMTVAGDRTMTLSFEAPLTALTVVTTDGMTLTVEPSPSTAPGLGTRSASIAGGGAASGSASGKPSSLLSDSPPTEASSGAASAQMQATETVAPITLTTSLDDGETATLTVSITEPTTLTTDGNTFTLKPTQTEVVEHTSAPSTTTNSGGLTILSASDQVFTFPTGMTRATTSTGSDGVLVTFSPPTSIVSTSTTSNVPGGILFPITTSISGPRATDDGSILPCNLWFFDLCLRWDEFNIFGWNFDLPPGIRPPGPPPPISIDPKLPVSIGINGKLPPWPAITIGPDRVPTYKSEPDDQCQTKSAELCATSTSYGVSLSEASTVTTSSKVASTCATVYGCNVEDTSTETTTVSGCTASATGSNGEVDCPSAVPYFISSKQGTSRETFESYVEALPDKGAGQYLSYDSTPWQSYITDLTVEQAKDAEKQPFMQFVQPVKAPEPESEDDSETPPPSRSLERRFGKNLESRKDSDQHLRMISARKKKFIHRGELDDYIYDPILGKGQTIFVIDDGFNPDHTELQPLDRTVDTHYLSNSITLPNLHETFTAAPADIRSYTGHGTHVASIAAGLTHGVASKANLVLVKIKNAAMSDASFHKKFVNFSATDEAMESVWNWINDEVEKRRARGDKGKFIVNMSNGYEWKARHGFAGNRKKEIMERLLERSWKNDIITVVAAGTRDITGKSLDVASPQVVGKANNPLITVGAVDDYGYLLPDTRYQDGEKGGSISVYADGEWVLGADKDSNDGSMRLPGTSQASPAVAGLAAYFASLPSLSGEWTESAVPIKMKQYITKWAFKRQENPIPDTLKPDQKGKFDPESIIVAYNRANEGLCSTKNPSKKRAVNDTDSQMALARRQDGDDVDIVVDGSVLATSWSESYCAADAATTTSPTETRTSIQSSGTADIITDPNAPVPATTTASFPSLDPVTTSIVTPVGSSCASTTPESTCNLGVGGRATKVCITSSVCADWVPVPTVPVPTINTDSGILTCGIRKDAGNAEYFFTGGELSHALDIFCSNMTSNDPPIKFEPVQEITKYGTYTAPDNVNHPIYMGVRWRPDTGADCPTMDFSKNEDGKAFHLCQDRLSIPINGCDTKQDGNQFWKQGGQFFRDCIEWEVTSLASACYYEKADGEDCNAADEEGRH